MLRRWAGALLLFSLGLLAGRLGCDFTAVSKLVIAPAAALLPLPAQRETEAQREAETERDGRAKPLATPLAVMATTMVDANGDRTKRLIQRNVRIHKHFFPLSQFPTLC
eukprot:COSAG03_NODE_3570_length_1944_cov_2.031436_2_plen_109_part_00